MSEPSGIILRRISLALLVTLALPAWGQMGGNPYLAEGRRLFYQVEYQQALDNLIRALSVSGNTLEEEQETHLYLGFCYVILEQPEDAAISFKKVLILNPAFRLPQGMSPKLVQAFESIRARFDEEGQVTLVMGPLDTRPHELALALEISDPLGVVQKIRTSFRWLHGESFYTVDSPAQGGSASVILPRPSDNSRSLFLYFQALARSGAVVTQLGLPDQPLRLELGQPQETPQASSASPWYSQWWLWTAVGVAVAAAVIIPVAISASGEPEPPSSTLGIMELPLR